MAQRQRLDLIRLIRAHPGDDKLKHTAEGEVDEGAKPTTHPVPPHPRDGSPCDPVQELPVQWCNRVFGQYGLSQFDPEFADYKRRLMSDGKKRAVAAVAVGHRAHRLAFSMLRSQRPYDEAHWAASVATGRSVMANAPIGTHQNDVTCPSRTITFTEDLVSHKHALLR